MRVTSVSIRNFRAYVDIGPIYVAAINVIVRAQQLLESQASSRHSI